MPHLRPAPLLVTLGLLFAWSAVAQAEPTARQIATDVQRFYDATKTYQAKFKQTLRIKIQNVKKVSTGRVVFARPGKISFRYATPKGNRVVSNGKIIKIYERDNKQMVRTKVDRSQYPAALAFLMGKGKLTDNFHLRLIDASSVKGNRGYVLEAIPRQATPAYRKLVLYVDGHTAQVRRVLLLDAQGNRNRFDFTEPRVNKGVARSEFTFTPPPGTVIVRP